MPTDPLPYAVEHILEALLDCDVEAFNARGVGVRVVRDD